MSKAGERLIRSAKQALDFAQGNAKPGTCHIHYPEASNPQALRESLNMTIPEFAEYFSLSETTVREREQELKTPKQVAK